MHLFNIFVIYVIIAGLVYYKTFRFIFRSDEWILYNPFIRMKGIVKNLWKIMAFEMFGDIRFFPLSHLLLFCQFKLIRNKTII
jgi:hypothetical protein